jgi:CubicO group peptidase (beta-lactamase class C family)
VPVFSCAKGIVSICAHLLAQEGRLDLDAPVSRYWPEFAQHGKETITPRMVLGHRAGLPVLDRVLSFEEITEWTPVIHAIEEQEPLWEPDTAYEYHGHVFGFLIGEVIRRITGLTPGAYFRRAVGEPLGLRAWIGLPAEEMDGRAWLVEAEGRPPMPGPEHLLTRIVTMNGALVFPGLDEPHGWNDPALLGMELPGAGATASASGLAGLYAAAVTGIEGHKRLLTPDTMRDAVREVSSGKGWLGFDAGARWGSGFLLDSAFRPMLGELSFGNDGAGGQFAFGDDEFGVGFAYVANRMIGHGDARANRLITAVRTCLAGG